MRAAMIRIRFRVDIAPGCSIGPGKVSLLENIAETGSLSAAARRLGMSYRRAWLLLDSLNHAFDTKVTTASVGGRGGGGVALTPFGRRLIHHYREFESEIGALATSRLGRLSRSARPSGATTRPQRRSLSPKRPLRPAAR